MFWGVFEDFWILLPVILPSPMLGDDLRSEWGVAEACVWVGGHGVFGWGGVGGGGLVWVEFGGGEDVGVYGDAFVWGGVSGFAAACFGVL